MTTSDQPTPLTVDELDALRRIARDPRTAEAEARDALVAKGMLQNGEPGVQLTPAGRHALDVNDGPAVPGLDN